MTFTPIASSSKGNAYLVEGGDGVQPLLLEVGIPIQQIREKTAFNLSGLAGCLVSHEHQDHAKAVKDLLKASIDCYMSVGTAKALGVEEHHRAHFLEAGSATPIGVWTVLPFPLEHDAAEPFGFIVSCGSETLLFVPDTAYVKPCFAGITIIAIECNNCEDILSENIVSGAMPKVVGRRVRRNHMSLERVINMLKANDLSRCRQIWLLHLSDANSDEERMIKTVQAATGIPTRAA
jgi:phosphoribosyl 1,2-cyclic phosphodiesterase